MRGDFRALRHLTGLSRSLVVVAPHPDDETIGCGGLIALATNENVCVTIVVVTDGAASHPGSGSWPPARIARQRRSELEHAIEILGVTRTPYCLGLPDSRTLALSDMDRRTATTELADIIAQSSPELVLTPWRREPHCDHQFSYSLTRDALVQSRSNAACVEYIVWTKANGEKVSNPSQGKQHRSFWRSTPCVPRSARHLRPIAASWGD